MTLPDKPDKAMINKILSDINLTEKDLEIAVSTMKQWLMKQPHLPPAASDENLLKSFIVGCKSVERAKAKLDNYFTFRLTYKDSFFNDRDPDKLDWKMCQKCMILPGMTPDGYKILLCTLPTADEVEDFNMEIACKMGHMLLDSFCRDPNLSSGIIVINDLKNLSVEVSMKCSISSTSASIKIIQDGCPFRIKGFIAINAPSLADTFMNTFFKPFLNKKLKDRVFIYSDDHKVLENHFPLEILPCDFSGGKNPPMVTLWENTCKNLQKDRDWFLTEGSQTVDESLRQKDIDKMKGTFRKLEAE